jgi:hypothetical protein
MKTPQQEFRQSKLIPLLIFITAGVFFFGLSKIVIDHYKSPVSSTVAKSSSGVSIEVEYYRDDLTQVCYAMNVATSNLTYVPCTAEVLARLNTK